jgi:hypothetical protein
VFSLAAAREPEERNEHRGARDEAAGEEEQLQHRSTLPAIRGGRNG